MLLKFHWRYDYLLNTQIRKINLLESCSASMVLYITLTFISVEIGIKIKRIDLISIISDYSYTSCYIHAFETRIS